jgi:16S rRNA (cytidine1402-2'-O)-methyltransferase
LRVADVVLCEDTRRTAILLARHEIRARELLSNHEHNESARVAEIMPRLLAGERVALVSDAGMPAVNDPGGRLVREALAAGVTVTVLPGASAVETALVASGLPAEQYRFLGYLPRRPAELAELWAELRHWPHPSVAFESPKRLGASLASLAVAEPGRTVAVCRELTKLHEEVVVGAASELADRFADGVRGEITLVVGGADGGNGSDEAEVLATALAAVGRLLGAGTPRRVAVDVVASLTGAPRKLLYDRSLQPGD